MRLRMELGMGLPRVAGVVALALAFFVSALGLAGPGMSSKALAHGYAKGGLIIEHPWARPAPGDTRKSAIYLTIKNKGKTDDTLLSARTSLSQSAELHSTTQEEGVMKMRKLEGGVKVGAGETIKFAPGGYHIMLLDLAEKAKPGAKFPLTLVFEKAGEVEVTVLVEKPAPGHGDASH